MRAVFVPTRVAAAGVSWLEATAPATMEAGTLTLYPSGRQAPRRTRLTPVELRKLLRQWARAVRAGLGRVQVGD
jgi:hypothetical protein